MSDCPPCERLDAFRAKIDTLPPEMQEGAVWVADQVTWFQGWAVRVIALGDHIELLRQATDALPENSPARANATRLREEFEALFGGYFPKLK